MEIEVAMNMNKLIVFVACGLILFVSSFLVVRNYNRPVVMTGDNLIPDSNVTDIVETAMRPNAVEPVAVSTNNKTETITFSVKPRLSLVPVTNNNSGHGK